jgi:hypothetical protein
VKERVRVPYIPPFRKVNMFESYGRLAYKNTWVVLECGRGIIDYYKYWVEFKKNFKLNTPLHGAHVTVVAGKYEDVSFHPSWKKYDGQIIKFQYDGFIKDDGSYFWIEVKSEELERIRRELGLTSTPKWPFHLTIGNLKNE